MNIILIVTDQQHADTINRLSTYDFDTPNLDELASCGRSFSRYVVPSCVCMPSRAALFSGLDATATGVGLSGQSLTHPSAFRGVIPTTLPAERNWEYSETIADALSDHGYQTVAFGKLHFTPTRSFPMEGFYESKAKWALFPDQMRNWTGPYYGFQHYEMSIGHGSHARSFPDGGHYSFWLREQRKNSKDDPASLRRAKEVGEEFSGGVFSGNRVIDVRREHTQAFWVAERFRHFLKTRKSGKRFFAVLAMEKPHHPYEVSYDTLLDKKDRLQQLGNYSLDPEGKLLAESRLITEIDKTAEALTNVDTKGMNALYCLAIYELDLAVGRIMSDLQEAGRDGETIVIFTSDHGDFRTDHGLMRKISEPVDSLLRVPLLIWGRGEPNGVVDHYPASGYDLFPTILDYAGAAARERGRRGHSLAQRNGAKNENRKFIHFSEKHSFITYYDSQVRYSRCLENSDEDLFDHTKDPAETRNVIDDARYAAMVHTLRSETLVPEYVKVRPHALRLAKF